MPTSPEEKPWNTAPIEIYSASSKGSFVMLKMVKDACVITSNSTHTVEKTSHILPKYSAGISAAIIGNWQTWRSDCLFLNFSLYVNYRKWISLGQFHTCTYFIWSSCLLWHKPIASTFKSLSLILHIHTVSHRSVPSKYIVRIWPYLSTVV